MELDLSKVTLRHGDHARPDVTDESAPACMMEIVSMLAGEEWGDTPKCVCPVIATFSRRLNDHITSDAERTRILTPLIPRVIGTRAAREVMARRGYVAADFAIRQAASALEEAWQFEQATALRAVPPIVDAESARAARRVASRALSPAPSGASYFALFEAAHAAGHASFEGEAEEGVCAAASAAAAYAVGASLAAAAAADAARLIHIWEAAAKCIERMCEVA